MLLITYNNELQTPWSNALKILFNYYSSLFQHLMQDNYFYPINIADFRLSIDFYSVYTEIKVKICLLLILGWDSR